MTPFPSLYRVRSDVSTDIFRIFVSALNGESIEVTKSNFKELSTLCNEFGFELESPSYRLSQVEVTIDELKAEIAVLQKALSGVTSFPPSSLPIVAPTSLVRTTPAFSGIAQLPPAASPVVRPTSAPSPLPSSTRAPKPTAAAPKPVPSATAPKPAVVPPTASAPTPAPTPAVVPPTTSAPTTAPTPAVVPPTAAAAPVPPTPAVVPPMAVVPKAPTRIDSKIISEVPEIFTEFQEKKFALLWRGSRDGFAASQFHRRCDGHSNTLLLILDTNGNIFGGYSPLEWSTKRGFKADESLRSFLFTLKNPHGVAARKFSLKLDMKHYAIYCDPQRGPAFGDGSMLFGMSQYHGIDVSDNCAGNAKSQSFLGCVYINDLGIDGRTFFTGGWNFRAEEIEVFEITD